LIRVSFPGQERTHKSQQSCSPKSHQRAILSPVSEMIDIATAKRPAPKPLGNTRPACFNLPRDFLDNRFVYLTISRRARGLSVGLDFNPDGFCNFDCVYCEVNRVAGMRDRKLDVAVMSDELERTLQMVSAGELRERPQYRSLPEALL